jgi:hypothetical protein
VQDLYDAIHEDFVRLDLPNLSIADKIFVQGTRVRLDSHFFDSRTSRPVATIAPELVRGLMANDSETARYYKLIRVRIWQDELILSMYFRAFQLGRRLFLEVNYFLLPPTNKEYHRVDTITLTPSWRTVLVWFGKSVTLATGLLLIGPPDLLMQLGQVVSYWLIRLYDWYMVLEDPIYDYGSSVSIRDLGSGSEYHSQFQLADQEMYRKIIEECFFNSVVDFLDARNVDTSLLRDRETTIINSGLIISGGSVSSGNLAIGTKARAGLRARKEAAKRPVSVGAAGGQQ